MTTILQRSKLFTRRRVVWTMMLFAVSLAVQNGFAAEPAQDRSKIYKQAKAAYEANRLQECKTILLSVRERTPQISTLLAQAECDLREYRACATHAAESLKSLEHKPQIRKGIEAMLAEATGEVGTVSVAVNVEGAEVSVDGEAIGKTPLEAPVYVEPGTRKIAVAKGGYATITREIEARKGASLSLTIDLPEEGKASAPAAPAVREPQAPANSAQPAPVPFQEVPRDPRGPNPLLLAAGGVVAVGGLATGLYFYVKGNSKYDDAKQLRDGLSPSSCQTGSGAVASCARLRDLSNDVDASRNVSTVAFVVGSAALVGTVVYWAWPRAKAPAEQRLQLSGGVAPGLAWLGATRAF